MDNRELKDQLESLQALHESLANKITALSEGLRAEFRNHLSDVENQLKTLESAFKETETLPQSSEVSLIDEDTPHADLQSKFKNLLDEQARLLSAFEKEKQKVITLNEKILNYERQKAELIEDVHQQDLQIKELRNLVSAAEGERADAEMMTKLLREETAKLKGDINQRDLSIAEKDKLLSKYWNQIQKMRLSNRLRSLVSFRKKKKTTKAVSDSNGAEASSGTSEKKSLASTLIAIYRSVKYLWGGFSQMGLRDLLERLHAKTAHPADRALICEKLAVWYAFSEDYAEALKYASLARSLLGNQKVPSETNLIQILCLTKLSRNAAAAELATQCLELSPGNSDYLIASSNCALSGFGGKTDEDRMALLNQIYSSHGLVEISRLQTDQPFVFANLRVKEYRTVERAASATISVVCVCGIDSDLQSLIKNLADQTWPPGEVILVIDSGMAGPTLTPSENMQLIIVEVSAEKTYIAKLNAGLARATGDFVTIQEGNSWWHSQKLEIQVGALEADPTLMASVVQKVLVKEDLSAILELPGNGQYCQPDGKSMLVRKSVLENLGGWNDVLWGAENEFESRINTFYKGEAVKHLMNGVPLVWAKSEAYALADPLHPRSEFSGARREYREMFEFWQKNTPSHDLKIPFQQENARPFPVPAVMDPGNSRESRYDLVVIADFNLRGGAFVSTLHYMLAAMKLGKSIGIFQWRKSDLNVDIDHKSEIRSLAMEGKLRILTAGEIAKADVVIVGYPVILQEKVDNVPTLQTEKFLILVNQSADRLSTGEDPAYDPTVVIQNVRDIFKVDPIWVPISGLIRKLMLADSRYPAPYFEDWNPLVDVDAWCVRPIVWRGKERNRPVIGRHSRDHYTKWPSNRKDLTDAYCVDKNCLVRLLGGAASAIKVMGSVPSNWEVLEFADDTKDFLGELDFFIHYPHEHIVEAFGRAVLEAMAIGLPVILPPVFEQTFGNSALYAEPAEVWPLIEKVWNDEQLYLERAEIGRAFCFESASYKEFSNRLERLTQIQSIKL